MFSRNLTRPIVLIAAALAIGGGAYGIISATAGSSSTGVTSGTSLAGHGGSNARSGPAAGGAVGTIASVSASGFTLATSAGQQVTVNGTGSTSASQIKKGESVLVLGTTDGTTITASQVIVQQSEAGGSASPSAVVPFQRGARSAPKQVGPIPASYSQGSGTIVGGPAANKATEAALAAYPGGIVDRVVKLGDGEYEVHNIGVNWPHHIFVNQDFEVVGAD